MAWSDDKGRTWSPMQKTNIPCSHNWSTIDRLPDGRLYILGSLSRNKSSARYPLAIALSDDDGRTFSKVWCVLAEVIHSVRNSEIYDGFIWTGVCHGGGSGRQDVSVVKIPIEALK
jgi:hypothetical protein